MAVAPVAGPQPAPAPGPAPLTKIPNVNVGQLLGQLSTQPPVGPIPITPYAPANVGPLAMPGAGLAGAQTTTPPWTGAPKQQPQQFNQFPIGGAMQPIQASGGPKDDRTVSELTPAQHALDVKLGLIPGPSAQQQKVLQMLMGNQPVHPVMTQPVPMAPAKPGGTPLPQSLLAQLGVKPQVQKPTAPNPLTAGRPIHYQQGIGGAPRNQ
jgi:hypothetical protein